MLKVLIVDDEALIREEVKSLVDWDFEGFIIAGEASNGLAALNMCKDLQPDIVLLDIRMPVMDGLLFMEQLNRMGYKAKVIILSSYEDFNYAQQGMRLGAFEYILKHLMDSGSLLEALRRARSEIQNELGMEARLRTLEERLEAVLPVGKQSFFRDLLENGVGQDKENLITEFERLGIKLGEGPYHLFLFAIDAFAQCSRNKDSKETSVLRLNFIKAMQQAIQRYGDGEVFVWNNNMYCILLNGLGYVSEYEVKKVLRKIANEIAVGIKSNYNISLSAVIASRVASIGLVRISFERAYQLLRIRIFTGYNKIFFLDNPDFCLRKCNSEELRNILALIDEALESCDIEKLKDGLHSGFMKMLQGSFDLESLDKMVDGLLKSYKDAATKHHVDYDPDIDRQVSELDSLERLHEFFVDLFSTLVQKILELHLYDNSIIKQAVNYIKKHYNEDINLNIVANHVSVNKVYLSILFKKVTGENYLDFVTCIRINKARELLEKNFKPYEVACMVGFSDPKYFSVVFKKVVGVSPLDYKKSRAL